MIKKLLLLFSLTGFITHIYAQEISGRVTSPDDPEGIPGANVTLKGSTNGTITDFNGYYTINATTGDTLVFSYIGYITQEHLVLNKSTIDVNMETDSKELSEVVVTALGIKRSEKALGYSIQKVGGDEVASVKEVDVINALSGKVSGVNIMQGDGSVGGGGSRIVIRGENSLAGNNEPLYIINGIRGSSNDIAADDIESISVLKGPAAAALYGAEAGAGVVIITSKSASKKDGIQVSYNANITFQTPLKLPEYQNQFGMGSGNNYSYYDGNTNDSPYWDDTKYNWGPAFDGEIRSQFTGNKPWVAYEDNVKNFYQTGHTFVNNIAVSSAGEHGNFRASYTNTDQGGIMPNTGLSRNNFSLNSTFNITNQIQLSANLNYIRTTCGNNVATDVRFIPRSIDIAALKNYWVPGLEGEQQFNYRQSANNPYFIQYENTTPYTDNKVIANFALNYSPLEGLDLMGRFGTDFTNSDYSQRKAYSTYETSNPEVANGYYKNGTHNTWNRNADFLISYQRDILTKINAKVSFGGSHHRYQYKIWEAAAYNMSYADNDLYNLNARDGYLDYLTDEIKQYEVNSLYAFLNLDFYGKFFIDVTNRDDWSSRLSDANNHFSYPSVSLSALMTDLFDLPNVISFWKIRGNISQVGKDIPTPYYIIENKYTYTSANGLTSAEPTDTKTDPNLKPEITTGYELGTDLRFFSNRLGIDFTAYYSSTRNQIIKIQLAAGSEEGKDYQVLNAGKVDSKGLEITLNTTPVKTTDFTWNSQINWSIDRTYVMALNDEITQTTRYVNSHLQLVNKVGERVGMFFGQSYVKHDGQQVYTVSGDTRLNDEAPLGNYNPDWMASWSNDISYKNLSLSCLFDLRYGGLLFNEIERKLNMYGLSEATTWNKREGIVPVGVVEREDGSYTALTLADLADNDKPNGMTGQEYWTTASEEAVPENALVDASYLKLREVRIAYNLPQNWFENNLIESASIAVVGRNLAVWSKVKHIDPETFGLGSDKNDFGLDNKVPGYANAAVPSVRSYGFTLNCKF